MTDAAAPAAADSEGTAPTLTFKVGDAHLQVTAAQTVKLRDDFHKTEASLQLPLDAAGRYEPAQLEGALASLAVVTARLQEAVSNAWRAKQAELAAEHQRRLIAEQVTKALQSVCVPPAEARAALDQFFGDMPATAAELQVTLARRLALGTGGATPKAVLPGGCAAPAARSPGIR